MSFQIGHKINLGKTPWNKGKKGVQVSTLKGLTKENSELIRQKSKKLSEIRKILYKEGKLKGMTGKDNPMYGMTGNKHPLYGKPRSEETKKAISETRKKRFKEGKINKLIGKNNPMYGRKITTAHKLALWGGWKNHHTKPEMIILKLHPLLNYTGNGKFWLRFKDGQYKNPDFIVHPKTVVEVFGDYWHKGENIEELIKKYNAIGWRCLIIWEKEINNLSYGELANILEKFINYELYEPIVSPHNEEYGIDILNLPLNVKEGLI